MAENTSQTSLYDLMKLVLLKDLPIDDQVRLIDELRKNDAGANDRWAYRYAIWILGGAGIIAIGGLIFLGWTDSTVPQGLVAVGSAAVGGLAGLLAPAPTRTRTNRHLGSLMVLRFVIADQGGSDDKSIRIDSGAMAQD